MDGLLVQRTSYFRIGGERLSDPIAAPRTLLPQIMADILNKGTASMSLAEFHVRVEEIERIAESTLVACRGAAQLDRKDYSLVPADSNQSTGCELTSSPLSPHHPSGFFGAFPSISLCLATGSRPDCAIPG